jgi:hypothetical protein
MVVRQLSNIDEPTGGPYHNTRPATVSRSAAQEATASGLGKGVERWYVSTPDGARISLGLKFERAVPSRAERELRVYSTSDPAVERIYRLVEVSDLLWSRSSKLDRVAERQIEIRVPELGAVFDGSEELVSITLQPIYSRKVFVP